MAQPTLNARPATWAGTSGPILYKFTSTNYANAGYYMAVEVWNSITAAKIANTKYYANSSGEVTVDVSAFLKSVMSLDNSADLTTSDVVYADTNWVKYYIKYREYWTAGSETQVDDVANLRYAVYGGLQLGSANNLSNYIPGASSNKFLMISDSPVGIKGYNFLMSAIGGGNTLIRLQKYLNGVLTDTTVTALTVDKANLIRVNETAYDRVDAVILEGSTVTFTNGRATGGNGFDSVSTNVATSTSVGSGTFDGFYRTISGTSGVEIIIYAFVTSTDLTGSVYLNMTIYNGAKSIHANIPAVPVTYNGLYVLKITTGAFDPAFVELLMDNGTAGNVDWSLTAVDDVGSETKSITIKEDCANTIMLQWRNSLGGVECYPFTYNQEYTYDYGGKKAKRLTLFADNLTLNQWEAIQGLNTNGQSYRNNIIEMTTSLNRTSSQIGQSVYVLNSDGSKTGVVVIPQENTTNTKQQRHSAYVTIEYPELFLQ